MKPRPVPSPPLVSLADLTLYEIVRERPGYGMALYSYGISPWGEAGQTLGQVCRRIGVPVPTIEGQLHRHEAARFATPALAEAPLARLMDHLTEAHREFMRVRMPYLMHLVEGLEAPAPAGTPPPTAAERAIGADLHLALPLFAQEFIEHIHLEEERLFAYVRLLLEARAHVRPPAALWLTMQRVSIGDLAAGHEAHDDEMAAIRELTGGYRRHEGMSLALSTLYYELEVLEGDLDRHAQLENRIFFPRALKLEAYVRQALEATTWLN